MAKTAIDRPVRRRAATRERLLDAARTVLAREGIQGASVEHICDQAGFTRGAFYSNFSSKDELVLALFGRERELMLAALREAADPASFEGLDTLDAVAVIMDRFLVGQQHDREWYLVHAEFELRGVRDDAVGREFVAASRRVRADFESFMASALEALGLRLTVDLSHVASILMGTYDAALRESLLEDRPIDLELLKITLPTLLVAVTEPTS
ncbi:TetR family transcriptional regulator [Aeromicrobium sp. SMF47]|uniref:TetR family transcriptional regulator n=1 Tax=Aeromicrobium yanjiei TaxID=2662028 RepID=A0A5Q2MFE8_9ACTN|nr:MULTISPECIES: TetR/AcrR family transcriptional regulator [Aeromicrobium]MRJ77006.1 TetR family transcriptional regulator [Aeromicrobium yanjiei]QGG41877.1 TetR family transcriptional regulator [Aeromicrobium yanjiei]